MQCSESQATKPAALRRPRVVTTSRTTGRRADNCKSRYRSRPFPAKPKKRCACGIATTRNSPLRYRCSFLGGVNQVRHALYVYGHAKDAPVNVMKGSFLFIRRCHRSSVHYASAWAHATAADTAARAVQPIGTGAAGGDVTRWALRNAYIWARGPYIWSRQNTGAVYSTPLKKTAAALKKERN